MENTRLFSSERCAGIALQSPAQSPAQAVPGIRGWLRGLRINTRSHVRWTAWPAGAGFQGLRQSVTLTWHLMARLLCGRKVSRLCHSARSRGRPSLSSPPHLSQQRTRHLARTAGHPGLFAHNLHGLGGSRRTLHPSRPQGVSQELSYSKDRLCRRERDLMQNDSVQRCKLCSWTKDTFLNNRPPEVTARSSVTLRTVSRPGPEAVPLGPQECVSNSLKR